MGDPKKLKKKYSTPVHPWNKNNIEVEREIVKEYSLRNKREIFIANYLLKKYKNIAKKLIATKTAQGEKEKGQVLKKLQELGLLSAGAGLDNILGLELKDVLERRLQSIVFRKGLARSMKQARQFIVHRHVMVGEKEITMPSYLVSLQEESLLKFKDKSALSDEEHPERFIEPKPVVAVEPAKETIKEKSEPKEETAAKKSAEEKPVVKKETKQEVSAVEETPKKEPIAEEKPAQESQEEKKQ